ncbi:alpha/beta fold hydrolase [Rhodococcus sp. SGAir0479]|uniref:alpha/beta fold hydrolase n=1 Tax=Rhodococcus sp. SGAir0479 TaxID=2567884 RepID=UPI0010CD66C1|nr:alpha/beta fold hydrolase [Rhodococcus sp. SGAir0479]QCQ90865.1 alpha/beta fold hydrolase [Rhodococcus sp. SGAir0479]
MQSLVKRIGVTAITGAVLAACAACGAGPSDRPEIAVVEHRDGSSRAADPTPSALQLQQPVRDLDWVDCTDATLSPLGLGAAPAGVSLECASFTAPLDPTGGAVGPIQVGAVRARTDRTPHDAAPVVLTSGSDVASSTTLAALATGPSADLLARQPIVAVDRRGIGASTPLDCGKSLDRQELADLGQFTPGDAAPADKVAALGRDAAVACTDALQPHALAFDTAHAADDLEQLRELWQVETLGVLATGNGSAVALAYAAKYPSRLGRLVLDAPTPTTVDAPTAAEQRVQGRQAALADFSRRCAALNCALGPDPTAALTGLRDRAAAGDLGTVSSSALLAAVSGFLGSPRGDQTSRVRELADILSAADRGDLGPLQGLIRATTATGGTDGQFVARCSDGQQWPGPGRAAQLAQEWSAEYPVFGSDAALGLMRCAAWPTMAPPPLPSAVPIPVLVFSGAADPVVGNTGLATVTGTLTGAGATSATLTWEGYGHPVTTHSSCARLALGRYLDSALLPTNGSACPA